MALDEAHHGWTLETLAIHHEALRRAELKFQDERDRRYAEVRSEQEKALRIKEQADANALLLARDIQTYKDMKANELREQIGSERGLYATKADLGSMAEKFEVTLKPLAEYISLDRGRGIGVASATGMLVGAVGFLATLFSIWMFLTRGPVAAPQVIYVPSPPGTLIPSNTPAPGPPR